ncbi:MAG TPA: exonuclease SbcCD subunit D [Acidimicrobiales bacterium]|nr:exonuclease SbcCD subunit D [Acidimicrobiales bacterium]
MRFVHTADWQLGMRRHVLSGEAQGRFTQDRIDAVAAVMRLAEREGAAFVVVAGDAFDDNQVEPATVARALEALRATAVPVWILPGNHDTYDSGSVYRRRELVERLPAHVRVVTDTTPVEVAPGVELVGAPWTSKRPGADPVADALGSLPPAEGVLRVLLAHGGCDAVAYGGQESAQLRLADLEAPLADGRVHYVALGDRHSTDAVGATGRIWYSGAPEPTAHVEHAPGNALVVDLAPGEITVTPHRVGRWSFRDARFDLDGPADVERLRRWFADSADPARTVARVALRGTVSLRDRAAVDAVLAEARLTHAAVDEWERHTDLVVAPDEADLEALDVGGFVRTALDELVADDDPAALDAVRLLYRLAVRS